MKTEEYPEIKFKPLSYEERLLINRIKQRVYLSSDEEIMSWIRDFNKCGAFEDLNVENKASTFCELNCFHKSASKISNSDHIDCQYPKSCKSKGMEQSEVERLREENERIRKAYDYMKDNRNDLDEKIRELESKLSQLTKESNSDKE